MIRTLLVPALLGLAFLVLPGAARAQADGALRSAAEVQAWFGELDQLRSQLEEIQRRALDDPQITAAQSELGARIKLAMERLDPELPKGLARMDAMEAEVAAASQRRDAAKLQQLSAEAERIQRRFTDARERVLQQPEMGALLAGFQQKVERKMVELSPRSDRLVARYRELEAKLASHAPPAMSGR